MCPALGLALCGGWDVGVSAAQQYFDCPDYGKFSGCWYFGDDIKKVGGPNIWVGVTQNGWIVYRTFSLFYFFVWCSVNMFTTTRRQFINVFVINDILSERELQALSSTQITKASYRRSWSFLA